MIQKRGPATSGGGTTRGMTGERAEVTQGEGETIHATKMIMTEAGAGVTTGTTVMVMKDALKITFAAMDFTMAGIPEETAAAMDTKPMTQRYMKNVHGNWRQCKQMHQSLIRIGRHDWQLWKRKTGWRGRQILELEHSPGNMVTKNLLMVCGNRLSTSDI
jgi:hypothetical protein